MTSYKETAHVLIDSLPEDKIVYVVNILRGLKGLSISDAEPDAVDKYMIEEIKNEADTSTISFDDILKDLGIDKNEL